VSWDEALVTAAAYTSNIEIIETAVQSLYPNGPEPTAIPTADETAAMPTALQSAEPSLYPGLLEHIPELASSINEVLTGNPSWVAALPTGARNYLLSIASEEAAIINSAFGSAGTVAPTGTNPGVIYGTGYATPTATGTASSHAITGSATAQSAVSAGSTGTASSQASSSVSKGLAAAATAAPGRGGIVAVGMGFAAGLAGILAL
jgi:hypothetical protein